MSLEHILILLILVTTLYMLIRNYWVYKSRCAWNTQVYSYRAELINTHQIEELGKHTYQELLNAVASYDEMLLRFWQWDKRKLIKNRKLFDLVIYNS